MDNSLSCLLVDKYIQLFTLFLGGGSPTNIFNIIINNQLFPQSWCRCWFNDPLLFVKSCFLSLTTVFVRQWRGYNMGCTNKRSKLSNLLLCYLHFLLGSLHFLFCYLHLMSWFSCLTNKRSRLVILLFFFRQIKP